jgi:electron-transferring-flavoprotein dehydrogenase
MVEWGAKTIPEGGYYAIPSDARATACVVLGDSAGYVEVASLKGVHYAVQSGILAARAIFDALKKGDVSAALAAYDRAVDNSFITSDLRARRNMRLAFKSGFYMGGAKSLLHDAHERRVPRRRIARTRTRRSRASWAPPSRFTPDGH